MRRNFLVAVSALALVAAPALAQTTSPGASSTPRSAGTGTSPSTSGPQITPKPDPMKQEDVSEIKGAAVYGSDDKKIGSIATVLMKPGSRTIDRLVLGAGGVLGVGARDVALPVDQFHWDATMGGFKIAKTEEELKQMPEWKSASSSGGVGNGGTASGSTAPRPAGARPVTTPPGTR